MKIKGVDAKSIFDSRKEKTISVSIKTNVGNFNASSPSGKSVGTYEAKAYKKNIDEDIKTLKKFSNYFTDESMDVFDDLRRVEDIVDKQIGANTCFALESAILKAIAKEKNKQVWELVNQNAKTFPRLVGNCIGGGKHSKTDKKPDFQEFLVIPDLNSIQKNFDENKKIKEKSQFYLEKKDEKFRKNKNDENAWITSLNEKEVLEILKNFNIPIGIDVAASSFYKRKKYHYENPMLKRDEEEQLFYIDSLIKNFNLSYVEDPFEEEDYDSFAKILKKHPQTLTVGDDLIVTNYKRLEKAIEKKSINALIVKPNQNGRLTDVKRVCELAKKNNIKIVFSHRSGETEENILADLAFGFQADFLKCGIDGAEREAKIKRLIEIEKEYKP